MSKEHREYPKERRDQYAEGLPKDQCGVTPDGSVFSSKAVKKITVQSMSKLKQINSTN